MTIVTDLFIGLLLRVVKFVMWIVRHKYMCVTAREHSEADESAIGFFDYSLRYAKETVVSITWR